MSFFKIINARNKSVRPPTMKPTRLTPGQKALADEGRCIGCGNLNAGADSYLCIDCQGKETIEDIHREISALRRHLLNKQ